LNLGFSDPIKVVSYVSEYYEEHIVYFNVESDEVEQIVIDESGIERCGEEEWEEVFRIETK